MKKLVVFILILSLFSLVACNPSGSNNGDVHTHIYSTDFKNDTTYHWFECECGARTNVLEHTFGEPFYDDERHAYVSACTICNARTYLDSHVLADTYTYDETAHWRDCSACDVKVYYREHDLSMPVLDKNTNEYVSTCITCPYEKRTPAHIFDNTQYHYDETSHWFLCSECGEKGEIYAHTFGPKTPGEEPCSFVRSCIMCGFETDKTFEHTWDTENGVFDEVTLKTVYTCSVDGCDATHEIDGLPNIAVEIETIYPSNVPSDMTPEDYVDSTKGYYRYKISMKKNSDEKLILRETRKTFYDPKSINAQANIPSNRDDFKYIGNLIPKQIYEIAPAFAQDQTPKITFGTAEFNGGDFNQKFFNFIRYIYISTNGRLLLSFEYDTSYIYQSPNLSYTIRGRFVVEECSFEKSPARSLDEFLKQLYVSMYNYTEFFSIYSGTVFNVEFLDVNTDSTNELLVGDSAWCDVNVEIPLLSTTADNVFWLYIIANDPGGIKDGLYEW